MGEEGLVQAAEPRAIPVEDEAVAAQIAHRTETMQQIAKHCISTGNTFRAWTRPP